jgi:dienelactone hydrolase
MKLDNLSRRSVLKGLGIATLAGAGAAGISKALLAAETKETSPAPTVQAPIRWHKKFKMIGDPHMDSQVLRCLAVVAVRLGDIGEILDTASRIKAGDDESFHTEFFKTAERVRAIGDNCLKKGSKVGAGEAYLRASNYYRASDFYLHANPNDSRILAAYRSCADCFKKGAKLLSFSMEEVQTPYEGTTLRGYFFKASGVSKKAPILIAHQGFDGAIEETYHVPRAANLRGYHCLLFEGPGQGLSIREKGLKFRPDWEKVITPVVDYVVKRSEVDPKRIAYLGISMGGYLAPRAAAFEPRLKVVIANQGIYDFAETVRKGWPPAMFSLLEKDPQAFNEATAGLMKQSTAVRWGVNDGMWKFGADSPADLVLKTNPFVPKNVENIKCKFVVMDGEEESREASDQGKKLYDALTCPKEYMLFTKEEAASLHCQASAHSISDQRLFDWLDKNI